MAEQRAEREIERFDCTSQSCEDCGDPDTESHCPESKRECGHHCNHSWTHDTCCWCKTTFTEHGPVIFGA